MFSKMNRNLIRTVSSEYSSDVNYSKELNNYMKNCMDVNAKLSWN